MNRILVIADDFTGAAEIGGITSAFGLPAQIAFKSFASSQTGALVIDSDTRHVSARDAAERLRGILAMARVNEFDFVFKKTDSVLRGVVAAEVEAVCEVLGFERCLLVPQNPSRGRTIEGGIYFLDGVELHRTSFADDPEFGARAADVGEILGGDVQKRGVNELAAPSGITIGDGKCAADLDWWVSQLTEKTLAAGGADFFTAILRRRGLVHEGRAPIAVDTKRALFICGSASGEMGRGKLEISRGCSMPRILFDAGEMDEGAMENWREGICEELKASGRAIVGIGHEIVPHRGAHVRRMLGEIAQRVMRSCEVGTLFVEGGATAAEVIQRLGWVDLVVEGEMGGGVVVLRPVMERERRLVVKPGSYAWPAALL